MSEINHNQNGLPSSRVLIVEDDAELRADLVAFLGERGFTVAAAGDVPAARQHISDNVVDICLLDIRLPGPSGKVFCREMIERWECAVVMMSSLSDSETVIALLEMGADDYLVKPFRFDEMMARLRAVLRRSGRARAVAARAADRVGPWVLELSDRRLRHDDGFTVTLTPSEAGVLRFLAASPGIVFSREDLLAVSRTRQHGGQDDRAMDNLMVRLRRKIEPDPKAPRYLVTVWGKGYRLDPTGNPPDA